MRYAIVSDIHANLPAWNTVLADIALQGVDRIICLGDAVGYGPEPAEVLNSVYEHVHLMVLGNHDAVVAGLMSPTLFNDRAQRMIEWTMGQLGTKAQAFFRDIPLSLRGRNFRCVHGDFTDPSVYNYIETEDDALASFQSVPEQLLFCGHSHDAKLFVVGASGTPHCLDAQDFIAEEGKRYIVNVGSVGYPRDGDPRASYVVFDEEAGSVQFFRLSYDFESFRIAAMRQHLSSNEIPMLRQSPTGSLVSVREALDFSPDVQQRVVGAIVESDVTNLLRKRMALWKWVSALAALAGVIAIAIALVIAFKPEKSRSIAYPPERAEVVTASDFVAADGNLLPALVARSFGGFSATPFRVVLSDAQNQTVEATALTGDRACIHIKSKNREGKVVVETPEIESWTKDRFEVFAKVARDEDFVGDIGLTVKEVQLNESGELFERVVLTCKFVNHVGLRDENLPVALRGLPNAEGWWFARVTSDPFDENTRRIRIEIVGEFEGGVRVGGITVRRK